MKKETIKSQTPKSETRIKPKTNIQLEKENLVFEIQINELKNKILKNRWKLLDFGESNPPGEIVFKDFPDD